MSEPLDMPGILENFKVIRTLVIKNSRWPLPKNLPVFSIDFNLYIYFNVFYFGKRMGRFFLFMLFGCRDFFYPKLWILSLLVIILRKPLYCYQWWICYNFLCNVDDRPKKFSGGNYITADFSLQPGRDSLLSLQFVSSVFFEQRVR